MAAAPEFKITSGQANRTLIDAEFRLIPNLVHESAHSHAEKVALICDNQVMDYATLDSTMDLVASALQRDGSGRGTVVAICASSSIAYVTAFLGALRAGAAVAPLPASLTAASLTAMLADCGATHLFLDAEIARSLSGMQTSLPMQWIALDESDAGTSFSTWLTSAVSKPTRAVIGPSDPFNIIYSSGTTGIPKGIIQSHGMRWAQAKLGSALGFDDTAITLCATPLYSNTTLVCFSAAIVGGGTIVLMPKFDAAGFLRLAEKYRATHTMLVPIQYQRIMQLENFDAHDLSAFRLKFCTSAPFSSALKEEIVRRWPGGLVEYYGMSEGGGTCMLEAHRYPDKLHTVGKPVADSDIRLIDVRGKEVPRGETGEVVCRSAAMMTGYLNHPIRPAEVWWHDKVGRPFIRTGDIGKFDDDGFLTLVDRKKDMIISGGFNVYPSDLEAVLLRHESVLEAAVVGVPSEQWGETPVAFVALKRSRPETAAPILKWVNSQLGKMQQLAALKVVPELPRNALGKVLKRELRDRYEKARQALM